MYFELRVTPVVCVFSFETKLPFFTTSEKKGEPSVPSIADTSVYSRSTVLYVG